MERARRNKLLGSEVVLRELTTREKIQGGFYLTLLAGLLGSTIWITTLAVSQLFGVSPNEVYEFIWSGRGLLLVLLFSIAVLVKLGGEVLSDYDTFRFWCAINPDRADEAPRCRLRNLLPFGAVAAWIVLIMGWSRVLYSHNRTIVDFVWSYWCAVWDQPIIPVGATVALVFYFKWANRGRALDAVDSHVYSRVGPRGMVLRPKGEVGAVFQEGRYDPSKWN